jgi:MFS family permease
VNKEHSSVYAAYVVLLLFLANMSNYGQRMVISILLPEIKSEIALTDGQLGVLMGGGFALLYAIAGVPLARLADRRGRVKWLALALMFWSAATGLFGVARTFAQMLAARLALGAGESICIPTSHSLLGDCIRPENRPFALGVHSTGGVVGATLAMVLGGYLGTHLGWRQTLTLFAIAGLGLGLVILLSIREPARGEAHGSSSLPGSVPLRAVLGHLIALRSYVLVLVSVCFGMLVEYGLNQWLPSYYVRQFALPISSVGPRYGLAVALGGIPGSLLGAMLVTILTRRDIRWLVWFPAAMYVVAIPLGLSMLLAPNANIALTLNGLYSFAIFSTNGALWGACFVHVPPAMRATTSAVTLLVGGITGLALGPILVGGLSDAFAAHAGSHSLQMSLVAVECLAICVVVPLVFAGRCVARERGIHPSAEPAAAVRSANSS